MDTKKRQLIQIKIKDIIIGNRQRNGAIDTQMLKFSIDQYGLLVPIIVEPLAGGTYQLLAGERRLRACKELGWKLITAILRETLSPIQQQEIELEENIRRKQLNWQDENQAIQTIFKLKAELNQTLTPDRFSKRYTQAEFAEEMNMTEAKVSQALKLASALDLYPELALCMSRREAIKRLRRLSSGTLVVQSEIMAKVRETFIESTAEKSLKGIEQDCVDLIITDFTKEFKRGEAILTEIFRVLKPYGYVFAFFHNTQLAAMRELMDKFRVYQGQMPYIWHKREFNTYQPFIWISKRADVAPKYVSPVISYAEEPHNLHDLAKPYQLYHSLIKATTLKGQFIVNPLAYDINVTKVCMDNDRNVLSICETQVLREAWLLNIRQ